MSRVVLRTVSAAQAKVPSVLALAAQTNMRTEDAVNSAELIVSIVRSTLSKTPQKKSFELR
jgi:hypothetical protein